MVAIDIDAPVLGRARARFPDAPVTWCHGDVLTHPLEPESFDAVLSNAALHHLPDTRAALARLGQLVRPGGTLAIVGFAARRRDLPWAAAAFISLGAANRLRGKWEHTAPQAWPPRDTFRQLRQAARETLPGTRIRRPLMGRYLLTWTRPPEGPASGGLAVPPCDAFAAHVRYPRAHETPRRMRDVDVRSLARPLPAPLTIPA